MSTFSPSHFLIISPELHFSIISHLSLSDKRHLRLVNQKFSNFLIFEVPLEELRTAREEKTIFLVEGARKGQLGFEPFIVRDVRKIREDSDNTDATHPVQPSVRREKILLDIYYPKFMRNDDIRGGDIEPPEKDEWEIKVNMTELSLYSESGDLDELPPGSTRLILAAREAPQSLRYPIQVSFSLPRVQKCEGCVSGLWRIQWKAGSTL
jgi:hypothetical protein